MTNYVNRLGFTAWRKKSAVLITIGLLTLIVFGLQYAKISDTNINYDAKVVALIQQNVRFVDEKLVKSNDMITERKIDLLEQTDENQDVDTKEQSVVTEWETDQQLGLPYVSLDSIRPYIPKQRIVHFDLKGAPLLLGYYKKVFPMLRNMGATGILLEYEDMFSYSGVLKHIAAGNAYTKEQIEEILQLAEKSNLEVIPLIQTFGHLEFALKHKEFSYLREVPNSPQAICPNRNGSIDFIKEMVKQVGTDYLKL